MASTKTTFHCSGVIIWFLFERTKISKGFTLTIGVTIKSTKIYTKIIYQSFYIQIMSLLPVSPGSSSYLLHQVCEPLRLESMPWNWLLIKVFQRDQLPNREAGNPLGGKNRKQFRTRKSMGKSCRLVECSTCSTRICCIHIFHYWRLVWNWWDIFHHFISSKLCRKFQAVVRNKPGG